MARDTERVFAVRSRIAEVAAEASALADELRERRGEASAGYLGLAAVLNQLTAAQDRLEFIAVRLDVADGIESP